MKKKLLFLTFSILSFTSIKSQCSFGSFPPSNSQVVGWTNGSWLAKKFTLSTTATLTGLGLNSGTTSAIPFRMVIYTDASNTPGNFVAASNTGTTVLGVNILVIPTPTVIPAGDYWIAANYNGSGPVTSVFSGTATAMQYQPGNLSNPPANSSTWVVGLTYNLDYWAVINTPEITLTGSNVTCLGGSVPVIANGAISYSWSTGANSSSITVSPTVNTTYTVSGVNAFGCINYAVQQVTVLPTPTLTIAGSNNICAGALLSLTVSGATTYSWSNGTVTNTLQTSPVSNVTYSVMGMGLNGCVSVANHSINVSALPSLTITGADNICSGSLLSQTISGAANYSWSTGAITNTVQLNPTSTTVYTVTGTDVNNCFTILTKTITVNSLPVITSTLSNPILCNGQTGTITIGGVISCTWNTGATGTVLVSTPGLTTNYTLTGMDANGCVNSVNISQVVNDCTGIKNEQSVGSMVKLLPNPNNGVFTVSLETYDSQTKIEVFNSSGQPVKAETLISNNTHFDFNDYGNGLYYLVISNGTTKSVIKMVKE